MMRRRKVEEEIQLLSTSFLDLLCCGLCSVVLLWVLTGASQKGPRAIDYSYLQISQTGVWHFVDYKIINSDGTTMSLNRATITKARPSHQINGSDVFIRHNGPGEDNEFAGMIIVVTDKKTTNHKLEITFEQCSITDIHAIRVFLDNNISRSDDNFIFTNPVDVSRFKDADSDLGRKYRKEVRINAAETIPADTHNKAMLKLHFEITGGRIFYTPPK